MQKRYGLDCINYLTDVASPYGEPLRRPVQMSVETKRLCLQRELEWKRAELDSLLQRLKELEDNSTEPSVRKPESRGWLAMLFRRFA